MLCNKIELLKALNFSHSVKRYVRNEECFEFTSFTASAGEPSEVRIMSLELLFITECIRERCGIGRVFLTCKQSKLDVNEKKD